MNSIRHRTAHAICINEDAHAYKLRLLGESDASMNRPSQLLGRGSHDNVNCHIPPLLNDYYIVFDRRHRRLWYQLRGEGERRPTLFSCVGRLQHCNEVVFNHYNEVVFNIAMRLSSNIIMRLSFNIAMRLSSNITMRLSSTFQ